MSYTIWIKVEDDEPGLGWASDENTWWIVSHHDTKEEAVERVEEIGQLCLEGFGERIERID